MRLKNVTFLNDNMKFETRDFSIKNSTINFNINDGNKESFMDCNDYLVIPGLVNAYFHSYSPLAIGLMQEMALQDWCNDSDQGKIQQLLFDYLDNEISEKDFAYIAQKSYVEMDKSGVT